MPLHPRTTFNGPFDPPSGRRPPPCPCTAAAPPAPAPSRALDSPSA